MTPPPSPRPPRQNRKLPSSGKSTPLIVAAIVGGTLLIIGLVALILFIFPGRSGHSRPDSADSESNTSSTPDDHEEFEDITVDEFDSGTPAKAVLSGSYSADGYISDLPMAMDISVSPNGDISGVFWNLLYDIKLKVSGRVADNGLSLDLGEGSSLSHMDLTSDGGNTYTGSWGKNSKPVKLTLSPGTRSQATYSGDGIPFMITGGGMVTKGMLTTDNRLAFYNMPHAVALPYREDSDGKIRILSPDRSETIAWFDSPTVEPEGQYTWSSDFHIINGNTFEITLTF